MAYTKLRTLTLRSKLKFGKYMDYTVMEVITILNKPNYLLWVYYNSSAITFTDEILDELLIEYRINKPGVDRDYWEKNHEVLHKKLIVTDIKKPPPAFRSVEWYMQRNLNKRTKNTMDILFNKSMDSKFSKGSLQRINQGHK